MPLMRYVGPHDAVDVGVVTVKRGETVDLPEDLLEQTDNWQPVKAATVKKKETR